MCVSVEYVSRHLILNATNKTVRMSNKYKYNIIADVDYEIVMLKTDMEN